MLNFTIFFTTDKMTSYDWCKIIVISVAVPMKSYVVLFTICHLNKLWKNCDLCYVHHIVVQRITNKITISLRLHLFRCKIFSIAKCFQMKMIFFFFSVFGCIPENILQCCAKDRAEGAGGWGLRFWKMLYEKIGRKPFSKF